MGRRVVHRYAAPFRAACGLQGALTTHVDDAKVTCSECRREEIDPAAVADFDQLAAHLRTIQCCCECSPPEFGGNLPDRECPLHGDLPSKETS